MENQSISRLHYFDRQFLRTQDFVDEQAYHLGMQQRHLVTQHSWGIVRGLDLALNPDCNPVVQPGIAVDGYGRTLVLQMGQRLPDREFDAKGSDRLDVWLAYGEVAGDDAPEGYVGCGVDGSKQSYYRTQEQPILLLEVPDPTHPDPRMPPGVPDGDLGFDGTRNAPRSPTAFWPVYLGRVQRKREKPGEPWQYSVSLDGRPYAGLVGEMVRHPTENAWIEIGTPVAGEDADTRFAVFLTSPAAADQTEAGEIEDLDPRLEITSAGQISLRGDASLNGNLVLEQGALAFRAQDGQPADSGTQQTQPRPWSIYRAQGEVQVEKALTNPGPGPNNPSDNKSVTSDLRLEMAGHDTGKSQVVIGAWGKGPDGKEAFQPCLSIDDDCNVTIERNLIVKGYITQLGDKEIYSIPGGPQISSEVRNLLIGNFNSTTVANVNQLRQQPSATETGEINLNELFRSDRLAAHLLSSQDDLTRMIGALIDATNGPKLVADAIVKGEDKGKALLGGLLDSDLLMDMLREELRDGPNQNERIHRMADRIKDALGSNPTALEDFIKRLGKAPGRGRKSRTA